MLPEVCAIPGDWDEQTTKKIVFTLMILLLLLFLIYVEIPYYHILPYFTFGG